MRTQNRGDGRRARPRGVLAGEGHAALAALVRQMMRGRRAHLAAEDAARELARDEPAGEEGVAERPAAD